MKAVLSNRIYLNCDRNYYDFLEKELTYLIPSYNPKDPPQVIKNIAKINNNLVSIPVGRIDLIPEGYEIVDKRITHPTEFPEFKGTLRDSQKLVHDAVTDSCVINAWVSWGKTFTGLAIAGKLQQKTLVIVHQVPLRNQWVRETEKVYGFQPDIIGSGELKFDTPIVVGNVQTLYRNTSLIKKMFGTVILDEVHHVPATTFARLIDTNYARYKIGLSGTIKRKDGKHVVIRDYFGDTVYKPPKENFMTPTIDIVRTPIRFPDGAKTPWANRVSALANNYEYRHLLAMLAAGYAAKGHKVLVVSDRVALLKECANLVGDSAICITGEIDHKEREVLLNKIRAGTKTEVFGTQAIFSEGLSVDPLSCLILGTPLNNEPLLEQLIGRVIRMYPNKLTPKIVDLNLLGETARRQASARIGYYMRMGYKIREL
jgi:superfamily II DNA or RNA helicase